ncbi:DUF2800 domain-containing protein [Candidatus Liberibacter sp.]|uniref:DUF2800 domain-containing protein n=1 Tax=Candidatus Liberibacter sp. TaxID=34022 RepID=UPI0038F66B4F
MYCQLWNGVFVNPHENPQLMLYACGALEEFASKYGRSNSLILAIIQLRIKYGRHIQEWNLAPTIFSIKEN